MNFIKKCKAVTAIWILLLLCGSTVAYGDVADPTPTEMYIGYFADPELLENAILTVIIEVPLFYLLGYRRFRDCTYFAVVNIVTNLLLNEFLLTLTDDTWYLFLLLLGECIVIALEFALCIYGISTERKKLFITLLLTNVTSFLVGAVYYWL